MKTTTMKGRIMWWILLGVFSVSIMFLIVEFACAKEMIDSRDIYRYIPPEPSWKDVFTGEEYVRYTDQTREREVALLHNALWQVEKVLLQTKPKSPERNRAQKLYDEVLDDILDLNSTVMAYTPHIDSFESFRQAYDNTKDKTLYTTKKNIKEWVLADGKKTTFKAVIGAITPKKIIFLSPTDKRIVLAYSRMAKVDRIILYSELQMQERKASAMKIEMRQRAPQFQPYPAWKVPVPK